MTFFCGSAVVATLASGITSAPLQEAAGMIVVPFEKSITTIGLWLTDINKSFQEKQDLIDQNEELKKYCRYFNRTEQYSYSESVRAFQTAGTL